MTLQVSEIKGEDVVCLVKNPATLSGPLYTLHVSQIRIDQPTLTDKDKEVVLLLQGFTICFDVVVSGNKQMCNTFCALFLLDDWPRLSARGVLGTILIFSLYHIPVMLKMFVR